MLSDLGELLYWAACWIAVTVALLALAAFITGSGESWVGVTTFMAVAVAIWLAGRLTLWLSRVKKAARGRRRRRAPTA
jgi:hypothetical protein